MNSIIIGAGTYGEVYLSYLRESGINVVGFIDDNISTHHTQIHGIPVLGGREILRSAAQTHNVEAVYCPIGNNRVRVELLTLARELGYQTPNYIHPSAIVSADAKLGRGVYILPGSIVMPYATIGDYTMVSMGVKIAHHSQLERGVFLSTGCNFGASIIAKEYAYCGISSTIMTGVKQIGCDSLIGAGAVVIRDVPDRAVVAGVPAKILKYKE